MDDQLSFASLDFAAKKKRTAEAGGVLWAVKEKAKPGRGLTKPQRARNRRFGKVRAKVEHVFRVLKCAARSSNDAVSTSTQQHELQPDEPDSPLAQTLNCPENPDDGQHRDDQLRYWSRALSSS